MNDISRHAYFRDSEARFHDTSLPTSVSGAPSQGPTHRQLICSFSGRNYVVEREDDMLNVYLVSAMPLPLSMTGDAKQCGCGSSLDSGRMTAAKLQKRNEALRAGGRW